jgi:hypothetical protein
MHQAEKLHYFGQESQREEVTWDNLAHMEG